MKLSSSVQIVNFVHVTSDVHAKIHPYRENLNRLVLIQNLGA